MTGTGAAVIEGDPDELVDLFYAKGWTDGLPIVLPSTRRVEQMLDRTDRDPQEVIGLVPPADGVATLELLAVNAVMAGCEPEHLPIVEAALRAALAPEHNLNGVTCTTHGCVPLVIVNGPQRSRFGFNATDGVFGNGCRANGAVGRALRLICWNLGGARPGREDKATMSHPGEWTFCMAEDEERSPWEPLHVERGMTPGSDAVTVFACESPHSVAAIGSPELMLNRIASKISARGSNNAEYRYGRGGELLVVINAEQARRLARTGWTKRDVKRWLWERTTRKVREWLEDVDPYSPEIAGRQGLLARGEAWADWDDPDADVPVTPSPGDIHVVVAGGNSYFAAVLPGWGFLGGFAVTRPVVHPGAKRVDSGRFGPAPIGAGRHEEEP
jgi:hypothetical protein